MEHYGNVSAAQTLYRRALAGVRTVQPNIAMLSADERTKLDGVRARYRPCEEFFSPHEVARLEFVRWRIAQANRRVQLDGPMAAIL